MGVVFSSASWFLGIRLLRLPATTAASQEGSVWHRLGNEVNAHLPNADLGTSWFSNWFSLKHVGPPWTMLDHFGALAIKVSKENLFWKP